MIMNCSLNNTMIMIGFDIMLIRKKNEYMRKTTMKKRERMERRE